MSYFRVRLKTEEFKPAEWTDVNCSRCKNTLFKGGHWLYFRPKGNPAKWMIFCREDCARLMVGKTAKLYNREEYANIVMDEAIRKK